MRVPNHRLLRPGSVRTLRDIEASGYSLVLTCSHPSCGTSIPLSASELIQRYGPSQEPDLAFRQALPCPACGARGGMLEYRVAH